MTEASKEENVVLNQILCIHHPICFKKNEIQALIYLGSKINVIILAFASEIGFKVYHTKVEALKIDNCTLKTVGIVIASF